MFAKYYDMMTKLQTVMAIKKMMHADERSFQEGLARIGLEEALQASLQMAKDKAALASVTGAVEGVTKGVGDYLKTTNTPPKEETMFSGL
jgi:hypothetical protein